MLSKHSSPKIKWYQLTDDITTNTMSWLGCWKILNSVSLTNSEQINNYQNFFFFKGFWVDPRAFQHPPVKQVLKYNNCFKTSTDNWPFLLLLVLLNILVKHFLVCTTNKKLTYPCNMDCTPEENQRMDWSKCWDDNKSNKKNAMLNTDMDKSSPPQLLHLHTYVDICGTM